MVSVDRFGFSKTDHNPFRSSSTGQEDKLDGQNRLGLHFERCQNLDDPMHEHSITINRFVYDLVYDSSKNSPELGFDRFFDLILESGPLDRVFQVKILRNRPVRSSSHGSRHWRAVDDEKNS